MSKERISYGKRFALWHAHAGRCPYCGLPIRLLDMQIDHILPEWLLSDPEQFSRVRKEYALDDGFDLCDFCNWLPTHPGCNRRKGAVVPDRNIALSYIALAGSKLRQARAEEERYMRSRSADQLVGKLLAAVEMGGLSKEDVFAALASLPEPVRASFDPIVVCFGLAIDAVLESGMLPTSIPTDYPSLCDWLERDLLQRVQSVFGPSSFYREASARDGETLSVRLALIEPDLDTLRTTDWAWWEVLEVECYSALYGVAAASEL